MTPTEADASTGWVCAHANLSDEFFADPARMPPGATLPIVQAVEEAEGIRITGACGFDLGCTGATFVGVMVTLPPVAAGAAPRMVVALAPIPEARIEDT